ncbi:hypothetical protein CYL21_2204 [Plasmodium falciparum NF54]|uniref:Uncharacterized protein n=4 Tax=Plasmodium falciparum TaxID=5833 RepID=Q8IL77_PLAF7|nr:conserved Plasmodium protein, unknown function [Plasmodium falciparum 3D7]ETW16184.1 hypothetical protein PFFVO_05015 [Plasmodium falciparum Vietnam Oak-Knoll (FVO)]ETW39881.1 hypothetical protein PFNF135_05908 [Plasmodium falciparum NF135/5.C10]KAF4329049.1 hypothetical protein CYL21_2204 [Plasmodium falciparum NF54]PKC49509.1 hypothetical protein CK202_0214 [Plasmodium falciparum NF54]CZU00088.1 conserved Plasmodium protein, unknown function [Plasmodium falciparum 3D7]|eukprot:XP_001348545.1 conserved Plasmodium protein, unknown function [Plasmodium falciparum 3D7]
MELNWKEDFEEIEITINKEKEEGKKLFYNFFASGDFFFVENYDYFELGNTQDILITEAYIKIVDKNDAINIDLYDRISIKKGDIKIRKNKKIIILNLKKKEKKLWGYLHFFSIFVIYKNEICPNLLKCTKEEKNNIMSKEHIFKAFMNKRRMESLEHLKKMMKKEKSLNREFLNKLEDEAQKIQCKLEEVKYEQFKMQKENIKKRAIDFIYDDKTEGWKDEKDISNNKENCKHKEYNKDDINNKNNVPLNNNNNQHVEYNLHNNNECDVNKNNLIFCKNNIKTEKAVIGNYHNEKKVIELKFTQLKKNELPARESRNLKKSLSNYSSTKNFFLIILIEKAKKMFFRNLDFNSSLEVLKSITECISKGNKLIKEEHIKVSANISLLYLLTNNLDKCIEECDKCVDLINEEIKTYNVQHKHCEIIHKEEDVLKIFYSLEEIKSENYIKYLYIIYVMVILRKIYAKIKKEKWIDVESLFISIEKVQEYLPTSIYKSIKMDMNNIHFFEVIKEHLLHTNVLNIKDIKNNLYTLNLEILKNKEINDNFPLNIYITLKRSYYLKNLNLFYKNVINIFLCLYNILYRQNKIYSFLNNIESLNLSKFLLDIYILIMLLKHESVFYEKIMEIEKCKNCIENKNISQEILNILLSYIMDDSQNEFNFVVQNIDLLKRIIYNANINMNDKNVNEKLLDDISEKRKYVYIVNLCFSDILLKYMDVLRKKNKNGIQKKKFVREIICSEQNKIINDMSIKFFSNNEYYKNIKENCDLLKLKITFQIIKTMIYVFNLIQKIYKNKDKEKIYLRNIISILLLDLSYSISNLNHTSYMLNYENLIISHLFLYFCFSFLYNFKYNEFIIDIYKKTHTSQTCNNFMSIENIKSEITKKKKKSIIKDMLNEDILLNNFYADYKNYMQKKKREKQMNGHHSMLRNNYINLMIAKICYLIKKIKHMKHNNKKNHICSNNNDNNISNSLMLFSLINDIYSNQISFNSPYFLKDKIYYLLCIQYNLILLNKKYKSSEIINFSYVTLIKQNFNYSFFLNNDKQKNMEHLYYRTNNMTIINNEYINKYFNYFTNDIITFHNIERNHFLKHVSNNNIETLLYPYIQCVVWKHKRIKIFSNINICLLKLKVNQGILIKFRNMIIKYMENLLIDFHILYFVFHLKKLNLSLHFFDPNSGIPTDLDHILLPIKELNKKFFKNKLEYQNIFKYYFNKFLKIKIELLSNLYGSMLYIY